MSLALATLGLLAPAPQSVIEVIPFTPDPGWYVPALISGDGGQAVRSFTQGNPELERFDPASGIELISLPAGASSASLVALSWGGDDIVLTADVGAGRSYFRLDQQSAATLLQLPMDALVAGASNDLGVIVGHTQIGFSCAAGCTAFRSNGTTSTLLSPLPGGGDGALVYGCSGDGSFIVGESSSQAFPNREACIWDASGQPTGLGVSAGASRSIARAVSDDGSVVGGEVLVGDQWRPARWTPVGGAEVLFPDLGFVTDVSADGRTILGITPFTLPGENWGFLWTEATGYVPFRQYLEALQVPGHDDWEFLHPLSMSDDGSVFVARGRRTASSGPQETSRIELDRSTVGDIGCTGGQPNSTGKSGLLNAFGSAAVQDTRLSLVASQLPLQQTCMLVAAPALGPGVALPGSNGTLCLTGTLGRDLSTITSSGPGATAVFAVDPSAIPQPNGPVAGAPGETWHFQVWHRDLTTVQTSNTTHSVSVTLL
ncbi:MAG: hypothetical protein AAFU73_01035 [Planctomycetota bacterium]